MRRMRSWLVLLSTAALLVHLALGCYAHPGHAEAAGYPRECDHDAHADHEAESPAPSDMPDEGCGHASCVCLPLSKVAVDDQAWTLPAFALPCDGAQLGSGTSGDRYERPPASAYAAVRPHLLYQVFLI